MIAQNVFNSVQVCDFAHCNEHIFMIELVNIKFADRISKLTNRKLFATTVHVQQYLQNRFAIEA